VFHQDLMPGAGVGQDDLSGGCSTPRPRELVAGGANLGHVMRGPA